MKSKLKELKDLLENASKEELLQVILEKDKPFGKQVMDIARYLQAHGIIPEDCGEIHWRAITTGGRLSLDPVPKDRELYNILKEDQRTKWAHTHQELIAKHFPCNDGNTMARDIFDYLHGYYPSLKAFPNVVCVFTTLRNFLKRNPEEFEIKRAGVNTDRIFNKRAIRAVRVFIDDSFIED